MCESGVRNVERGMYETTKVDAFSDESTNVDCSGESRANVRKYECGTRYLPNRWEHSSVRMWSVRIWNRRIANMRMCECGKRNVRMWKVRMYESTNVDSDEQSRVDSNYAVIEKFTRCLEMIRRDRNVFALTHNAA